MTRPITSPRLILASTSATRKSVLANAGIAFDAKSPDCDEELAKKNFHGEATGLALHLAHLKALSLSIAYPDAFILGADQTLLFEGEIFSKPQNREQAISTLARLSGQSHTLRSALAIARHSEIIWETAVEAHLHMRVLSPTFIAHYVDQIGDEILQSVGCYQIEALGIQLFDRIEGDHFTILGLPLLPLLPFLRSSGMLVS
jgi:septum formation protein